MTRNTLSLNGSVASLCCRLSVPMLAVFLLGAAPARPMMPHVVAHRVAPPSANRHLHQTPTHEKPGARRETHVKRDEHHKLGHHPWHRRWDYWHWVRIHRGTGTIVGTVYGTGEKSGAHAHVILRTSKGKIFKSWSMKHVTTADSSGHFVMRFVRPGAYRIRANQGKTNGHTPVAVHAGVVSHETVKL